MKKAFIFDLFGTLVNVFEKEKYIKYTHEMGMALSIDLNEFDELWNNTTYKDRMLGVYGSIYDNLVSILKLKGITIVEEKVRRVEKIRRDFTEESLLNYRNNVLEVLDKIKSQGYKIGLISDCSPDVPEIWNKLTISQYFDEVIFSCKEGIKKPDPKIYELMLSKLNLKSEECFYVGDGGSNELNGAQNVGMRPILIKSEEDENSEVFKKDEDSWKGERIYDLRELYGFMRMQ